MKKLAYCAIVGAAAWLSTSPALATVVYSDVTTFTGQGYSVGTSSGTPTASGGTADVLDDITPTSGFGGGTVTSFTFSVANFNGSTLTISPTVYFYSSNGTGGAPGTLLAAYNINPISKAAGVNLYTVTGTNLFTLPTGTFWAGLSFSGAGRTAAQLENFGQGVFNPPTVGTSQDMFFQASSAASNGQNSPAGGFYDFGGAPVANFGWAFTVATPTAAVPEPATWAMLMIGFGGAGVAMRRRTTRHVQAI